jgi:glycine betaine catabolism B
MPFEIEFKNSEKNFEWEASFGNLLNFAESKGIQMESNCRIGVCGGCKVKLISGKVIMETEDALDEADRNQNMILPCVASPETDVVIDA